MERDPQRRAMMRWARDVLDAPPARVAARDVQEPLEQVRRLWPHAGDAQPEYRLVTLGKAGDDPLAALRAAVDDHRDVSLTPLTDWQREVTADLKRWFDGSTGLNPQWSTPRLAEAFVVLLSTMLGPPAAAWRVEVEPKRRYFACDWLELLFRGESELFLLSLEVHD